MAVVAQKTANQGPENGESRPIRSKEGMMDIQIKETGPRGGKGRWYVPCGSLCAFVADVLLRIKKIESGGDWYVPRNSNIKLTVVALMLAGF